MIKVKVRRHYEYLGGNDRVCDVRITLPVNEKGWLLPELQADVELLQEELSYNWGVLKDGKERCKVEEVCASTWEELEQEVRRLIDESIEKLREVYKKNSEEIKRTPQDEEEVYFIE